MMLVTMNDKEILKFGAIRDVCEKRIRRADAARVLSLSVRQVQRLVTRFRQHGVAAIVHQRRGQSSSNRINHLVKLRCLTLIREHWSNTCSRKLTERHDIHVSVETLRQWMIADALWVPHAKRKPRVYQPRHRRDCLVNWFKLTAPTMTGSKAAALNVVYWFTSRPH